MSRENVEVVQAALDVWSEVDSGHADAQRLTEFFAPDVTWEFATVGGWPEDRVFRGFDEFLAFRDEWTQPFDEWSYEAEKILDAGGNRVVAKFRQRGKPRGSDSWVEQRYAIVYAIEDGLIQRCQVYTTADEALEAVGLRE
jgi:ketosteroid isomerase-like protein